MSSIRVRPWAADRPVRDSYLIFGSPQLLEPEIDEVVATLRSAWIGTGPRVAVFEEAFRQYLSARHAVAVNSCTAALHLAMIAIDLAPGDEVLVPSMTFAATANAIIHAGGKPVLTDVDRQTMCLAPEDAGCRVTDRTRAIMPVVFRDRPAFLAGEPGTRHRWPLYTDITDTAPGQATGQALNLSGGLWYVLAPSGKGIRTKL